MRDSFRSVSAGGLRHDLLPMRLFQLSKRWAWDPSGIDFTQDVKDWQKLTPDEQDSILRLTAMFQAGEEAVTLDLLPLIQVIAGEGRIEEELYLTSFLYEEAKHVEFFSRFLQALGIKEDLHRYHTPSYRQFFYEELPRAMTRLATDTSRVAQAEAAVTYNIVAEGLMAETGYHSFFSALRQRELMPGLCWGIERTKNDESRHIAWGLYHCSRLVAEDPALLDVIRARAGGLFPVVLGMIQEFFAQYETPPFGFTLESFLAYAADQYQRRMGAIERAQGRSPDDVGRLQTSDLGVEEE